MRVNTEVLSVNPRGESKKRTNGFEVQVKTNTDPDAETETLLDR